MIQHLLEGLKVGRRGLSVLTARKVQTAKKLGYTADGMHPGLNLQVSEGVGTLVRSWVFRYTSPTTKNAGKWAWVQQKRDHLRMRGIKLWLCG